MVKATARGCAGASVTHRTRSQPLLTTDNYNKHNNTLQKILVLLDIMFVEDSLKGAYAAWLAAAPGPRTIAGSAWRSPTPDEASAPALAPPARAPPEAGAPATPQWLPAPPRTAARRSAPAPDPRYAHATQAPLKFNKNRTQLVRLLLFGTCQRQNQAKGKICR